MRVSSSTGDSIHSLIGGSVVTVGVVVVVGAVVLVREVVARVEMVIPLMV